MRVFYAQVVLDCEWRRMEIDSRPSDALALAVRAKVPIYVNEAVMDKAAIKTGRRHERRRRRRQAKKLALQGFDRRPEPGRFW